MIKYTFFCDHCNAYFPFYYIFFRDATMKNEKVANEADISSQADSLSYNFYQFSETDNIIISDQKMQ